LLVVAVFNPIKDRVQKVVDKRFKEAPGPARRLNAFQDELRSRVSQVDVRPITRRFLDEAVTAFDAERGVAYLDEHGNLRQFYTAGEWKGEAKVSVAVESSGAKVACIALAKRRGKRKYAEPDFRALEKVAQSVGQALEEDGTIYRSQDPQ
jgi:hypothetical protein